MDTDRSDHISRDEFLKGMEMTGLHYSEAQVQRLFDAFDEDGQGDITWPVAL